MDNLDLYKRSMQNKHEAYSVLLKAASEVELLTSTVDWEGFIETHNARTITGEWLTWLVDGVCVRLNLSTMCMMADKGGGNNGIARYLLDYTQHDALETALNRMMYKK